MNLRHVTSPVHHQLSIRLPAWSWAPVGDAADVGRLYGWAGPVSISVRLDDEVSGGAELRLGEIKLLSRDIVAMRPADLVEATVHACERMATEIGDLVRDAAHALDPVATGVQPSPPAVPDDQGDELAQRVELVEVSVRSLRRARQAYAERCDDIAQALANLRDADVPGLDDRLGVVERALAARGILRLPASSAPPPSPD